MSLWWLQPGWTSARCACGRRIWPEGDPDWGACYECFTASRRQPEPQYEPPPLCHICGQHPAVAGSNGYGVCSEACDLDARRRPALANVEPER